MRQEEILDLIFDLAPPHQGTTVAPRGHCQGTTDKSKQMPHIPTIDIDTVLQEQLQPMSDGKRHFIVGSFLCYSYKIILISPGIFHRALFEK